jgi:glycosyltransferase involved in cell wall biosynthesis
VLDQRLAVLSIAHPLLFRGGAQQSAYDIYLSIRDIGVRAIFVAADSGTKGPQKAGVYLRPSGFGSGEYLIDSTGYDFFWHRSENIYAKRELLAFLAREKVTHVFLSHFAFFGLDLILLLKSRGCRVIVGFHEMLVSCFADGQMVTQGSRELCTVSAPERCSQCFPSIPVDRFAVRARVFKSLLSAADGYTVPSEFLKERLVSWGLPREKVRVIWHPVHEFNKKLNVQPRSLRRIEGLTSFGYFGQIFENKGLLTLLGAGEILDELGIGQFRILINGANKEVGSTEFKQRYSELLVKSAAWKNGAAIERGPYLHNTLPYRMQEVDVVVIPSIWWEVYGMVLDEAKAFGKPVIVSDIGGMPERVRTEDGILFPPADCMGLAAAMAQVMRGETSFSPAPAREQRREEVAKMYLSLLRMEVHQRS